MVPDADQHLDEIVQTTSEGDVIHKVKDDPRVTRLGRRLRQFSLDALPLPEDIRTEVLDFAQFLSMRTRQSHSTISRHAAVQS